MRFKDKKFVVTGGPAALVCHCQATCRKDGELSRTYKNAEALRVAR